jgi:hypothetical protein
MLASLKSRRLLAAVKAIIRDAGLDPSVVHPAFISSRVNIGQALQFSPHEIVLFIARDWHEERPRREGLQLFKAAVSANKARASIMTSAGSGIGMVQAASLLLADPYGQLALKHMMGRRTAALNAEAEALVSVREQSGRNQHVAEVRRLASHAEKSQFFGVSAA